MIQLSFSSFFSAFMTAIPVPAGILHKGNGENIFISQQPPVITTVMGNGNYRTIPCPSCNGPALEQKLFAPVAVACGSDGSVYVGDFNFVRRILPNGFSVNILELRYRHLPESPYVTRVSGVGGELNDFFIFFPNTKSICCAVLKITPGL